MTKTLSSSARAKWRISAASRSRYTRPLAIFLLILTAYSLTAAPETVHWEHVIQARAWLAGHFYIDQWANLVRERVEYRGHWYEVHPPLSAAVMLVAPYPRTVSIVIGAVCAVIVWCLTDSWWVTVFFAFGTNFWWCATDASPWNFALVLGCTLTFGALLAIRTRKPLLAGLLAGSAALARYDLVLVVPVYLLLLWDFSRPSRSI